MSIVERRLHDWKEILTILELNWTQRLEQDKIEHLSSYAHVVCTTGKQVISRRRKNEDVFTMSKDEKCTCKACKNPVFHCQICKFVGVLLPSSSWLLKLPITGVGVLFRSNMGDHKRGRGAQDGVGEHSRGDEEGDSWLTNYTSGFWGLLASFRHLEKSNENIAHLIALQGTKTGNKTVSNLHL